MEKQLSGIEGQGASVLKKLLNGDQITSEERKSFSSFVTVQDFRSPRQRQNYADLIVGIEHNQMVGNRIASLDDYKELVAQASATNSPFDLEAAPNDARVRISEDGDLAVALEDTVRALAAAEYFAPVVASMDWMIYRTNQANSFILSDSPVRLFEDPETLPENTGPAYWRESSRVALPLSSSVCFVAHHRPQAHGLQLPPRLTLENASAANVRFFNDLQLSGCMYQVYAQHAEDWLAKKCEKLEPSVTQLSFMPVGDDGNPASVNLVRGTK